MTRILSLGQNNGITIMILNLAPIRSYHLDTLSSLNVSSRAKRIEVREIENEVVFKQPPRSSSNSSSGTSRQPLRPLANAHNIHSGTVAANKAADKPDRPVKAFSVFSDRSKPQPASRPTANTTMKRSPLQHKRPSDSDGGSRPSKITRPALIPRSAKPSQLAQPSISADQIEAMVEKKVSEILASRTQAAPAPPEINEAVQRRLEALEKRIEDARQDDSRSDGLRFLLMARQHKERGEEASALKMYEMALPYFPGQAKLLGKIEKLKARLQARHEVPGDMGTEVDEYLVEKKHKKFDRQIIDDDDFNGLEADDGEIYMGKGRKQGKKSKATKAPAGEFSAVEEGPVSQNLLGIVNSRDIALIRSLQGFGPKKARDLVDYLELLPEEDGGRIDSLEQLRAVPGMGGRTVDRAYEGLLASFGVAC